MVEKWRKDLLDLSLYKLEPLKAGNYASVSGMGEGPSSQTFASILIRHPTFTSLQSHLSPNFIDDLKAINNMSAIMLEGYGPPALFIELSKEISNIEKNWGLI